MRPGQINEGGLPPGYSLSDFARYSSLRDRYRDALAGGYRPEGYNLSDFAFYAGMRDKYEPFIQARQQGGGGMVAPGQVADPSQNATGFQTPPTININIGDSAGNETAGVPQQQAATKTRKRQALQRRRYGQQQGMGQGYQYPRPRIRPHATDYAGGGAGNNTSGYTPRTSGMYGSRPANMRQQWSNRAANTRPFGGRRAVRRYYEPQVY